MDTVPVVDIGPFLERTAKGEAAVAQAVDNVCWTLGFLITEGHACRTTRPAV
jgi:hypothetical protein